MDHAPLVERVATAEAYGLAVRAARRSRGFDQAELAHRCQVSRMTISRLENGHDVNLGTAIRALSECGFNLTIAPKAARVRVDWMGNPDA